MQFLHHEKSNISTCTSMGTARYNYRDDPSQKTSCSESKNSYLPDLFYPQYLPSKLHRQICYFLPEYIIIFNQKVMACFFIFGYFSPCSNQSQLASKQMPLWIGNNHVHPVIQHTRFFSGIGAEFGPCGASRGR